MLNSVNSVRVQKALLAVIGIALLVYSVVRAASMSLTIDEAFTFERYVKNANFFPQEYDMHTANYHMLNTWLMIVCSKLFGIAEWSLRLPGVLAQVFYLYFTAKLSMKSKSLPVALALFILLNIHPYMLDFFSVARGYGLLMAFVAGSLWHVSEFYAGEKQMKNMVFALVFAGLAMWANFVGLLFFTAIASVVFLGVVLSRKKTTREKLKSIATIGIICLPFAAVAYSVIAQLKDVNAFFWVNDGFWNETVRVLGAKLAYPLNENIYAIHLADNNTMIIALAFSAAVVIYAVYRNRQSPVISDLILPVAVLLFVLLEAFLLHVFMHSPYPSGRIALFLLVIFLWIIAVALRDTIIPRSVSFIACAMVISFQLWFSLPKMNLKYTSEWQFCESVKQSISDLSEHDFKPDNMHPGITVSSDMEFGNILAYYLRLKKIENIALINCGPAPSDPADYYIVSRQLQHTLPLCDTLRDYGASGLFLLHNASFPPMHLDAGMKEVSGAVCIVKSDAEQCLICTHEIAATDSGWGRLNFSVNVKFSQQNAAGLFLIWHDRDGQNIWNGFIACDAPVDGLTTTFTGSRPLPLKVQKGDVIKVLMAPYLDPGPIEVSNASSSVYIEK
jgi:hypothetical protein